jgi:hypothetical protein
VTCLTCRPRGADCACKLPLSSAEKLMMSLATRVTTAS